MKLLQSLTVVIAITGYTLATKTAIGTNHSQIESVIECTLYKVAIMGMGFTDVDEKDHVEMHCMDDSDMAYTVSNLPEFLLRSRSGSIRIHVDARVDGYKMDLKNHSASIVSVKEESRPLPYQGNFTAAVIRITGADGYAPANSAAKMSDEVFGLNTDQFNLVSGFSECSGGKTNFSPCTGQDLVNGVLDITIPWNVNGIKGSVVQNYVTNYLASRFDRTKCTNVLYAYPSVVDMGIAYGYFNSYLTAYKSPWESRPSSQMHELGHNFDFHHSGEGGNEYSDRTCMLGYSYHLDEGPRMCFNAAKSWYFGWYADRHITVDTNEGMRGRMISIDDYLKGYADATDQYTIAKVYESSADTYYFMFNRKEGINGGVIEYGNELIIVNQNGNRVISERVAHLSDKEQFTKSNFASSGSTLVIKVCEIVYASPPAVDYAYVIVEVNNNGVVDCPPTTSSPTSSPAPTTSSPTCRSIGTYKYLKDKYCKGRSNPKSKFPRHWQKLPGTKNEVLNTVCNADKCEKKHCCENGPQRRCNNTGINGLRLGGFTKAMCGKRWKLRVPSALKKRACTARDGFRCSRSDCCRKLKG